MVSQMERFSESEGDDGTHPLQPQQSLKRKSNQTPLLLGFCQLQMFALKQTGLLILCRLLSLSLQYGWLLFCSRLLRDWPLFFVVLHSQFFT